MEPGSLGGQETEDQSANRNLGGDWYQKGSAGPGVQGKVSLAGLTGGKKV